MFEDDCRNLKVPHSLGMRTVHVAPTSSPAPHIMHHTDDISAFLAKLSLDVPNCVILRLYRRKASHRCTPTIPYGVQNDTTLTNRPHLHNDRAPQYTRYSLHYLYGLDHVGLSDSQVGPTSAVLTCGLSCPNTDVLACADFTRLARLETTPPQAIVG